MSTLGRPVLGIVVGKGGQGNNNEKSHQIWNKYLNVHLYLDMPRKNRGYFRILYKDFTHLDINSNICSLYCNANVFG